MTPTQPPNPLPDSFAGINARFHLAGIYTLSALLLQLAQRGDLEDPAYAGFLAAGLVLFYACVFGVLGLVYQAASGGATRIHVLRWAGMIFLPMLWLSLKIIVLVYGLLTLAAYIYYHAASVGTPFEPWLTTVVFWTEPLVGLVVQVLALYSMPLCIRAREKGQRRAPIREGLRLFVAAPLASRWLLLVLVLIASLGAGLTYARGPAAKEAPPDIPDAMVLFATSYLGLVAFFGATRVVLQVERDRAPAPAPWPAPDLPEAPAGPPA